MSVTPAVEAADTRITKRKTRRSSNKPERRPERTQRHIDHDRAVIAEHTGAVWAFFFSSHTNRDLSSPSSLRPPSDRLHKIPQEPEEGPSHRPQKIPGTSRGPS